MGIAQNASPETRAFLRQALALPMPTHADQVETTRNLAVRLERQKAGRKAADIARAKRQAQPAKAKAPKPVKPAASAKGAGTWGGPRRGTSLTHEQQQRIREIYAAGNYGTLKDLAAAVGCEKPEIVIQWMAKAGIRKRRTLAPPPADEVPDGCISTSDLLERIGLPKSKIMHRLNKAGIRAVGGRGNLYWYSVAELQAAGFLP